MHNLANARFFGAAEEALGVLNGLLEGLAVMLEADPVGIVEAVNPGQSLGEPLWILEIVREGLDQRAEWIGFIGMGGDGLDLPATAEQPVSDVAADIAEGSGHHVCRLCQIDA